MWPDRLPASVAFCDVETTGLGNHDRIASFGGIGMISRNLVKGWPELEYVYLVFNPGTQIGRVAEQIHGFSASALRLQDPFAMHAADIHCFLTSYELLVAHNAAFDIRFINRELRLSGLTALTRPIYCTMKGYRALGRGGSASLSTVCRHIKLARAGDLHNAIEDAWLAMQIYLWLQGCPLQPRLRSLLPRTPSNLRLPKIGAYHVGQQGVDGSHISIKQGDHVKPLAVRPRNVISRDGG
jgi:DNA polymerase III subunit epsilon